MGLPRLREELDLLPGPVLPDGQPSWTLHDPVRGQFFRIDWHSFEVLQRWAMDDPVAIAAAISADTTLQLEDGDVLAVVEFLVVNQLTHPHGEQTASQLAKRHAQMEGGTFKWLLHHYLFFRIPLWHPDAWLGRWQGVASWFYSRQFFWLTFIAFTFGMIQVGQLWSTFATSLVDTLSLTGLMFYGVTLIFVKVLHELGHAFTAKRMGCRVPTMGIAFLVMWPVAYTDTNDTWRLTDRKQRLQVASAGIATELVIAAWATLAWTLLPDGTLRSGAFLLATTSWVATLAINVSPFMRFDGYFILSDLLDMSNLHERCFALARWKLREWLFDLGEEPPEFFTTQLQRWLIVFAWATWLYRLVVFLGIAVLVYHFAFKLLGVFLFGVEILWFVARPLWSEIMVWRSHRDAIRSTRRSRRTVLLVAAFIALFLLPWPGRVMVKGLLHPAEMWPVFAPVGARIEALPYGDADEVVAGAELLRLYSPELLKRQQGVQARVDLLRWQAAASAFDAETRNKMLVNEEALSMAQTEKAGLDTESLEFSPLAPFDGRLYGLDPDLRTQQWVSRKEKVAQLVRRDSPWVVETWLDESEVQGVQVGDRAIFITDGADHLALHLRVQVVDVNASATLSRHELSLDRGGHVQTREKNGQLVSERAIYHVSLVPDPIDSMAPELTTRSWRGDLTIKSRWESPSWRYFRQALVVVVREFGF